MAEKLSLGGRDYDRAVAGTVRHDLYVMQQARYAGLTIGIQEGETPERFAERLLASCLASGRALLLLGALLWPAGTRPEQWTEQMAEETAERLGAILDPAEKQKVYRELTRGVLDFFEVGLGSWVASMLSSAKEEPSPTPSKEGGASGPSSSEPSPAMTTAQPSES